MKSSDKLDFLNEFQPFADWRSIRRFLQEKYQIRQGEAELLFDLHKVEHFTTDDFKNGTLLLNWDKHRFRNMINEGWIEMYRERTKGSYQKYNIYCLSRRAKALVREAHEYVAGVKPLPTKLFEKKKSYTSSVLKTKINDINDKL